MLLPLQFIPGIKGMLDEEEIEVRLKSYNKKCGDPDCYCPPFGAIFIFHCHENQILTFLVVKTLIVT